MERRLPHWYVHTWDRTRDGERSFRLDRMRSARLQDEEFEPREGFQPSGLRDARSVRVWYSPEVARWRLERALGAKRLRDGSAIEEVPVGGEEWLVGEILSFRGEAVVLEPPELRSLIAERARSLLAELGLTRVRVPSAR
jgi:predicted DNA-binding transcriptional regulator YafY